MMKTLITVTVLLFSLHSFAAKDSIVGRWKTIDDETGQAKSIVEIFAEGDTFKGKVAEIFNPTQPNPICDKCSGDKANQPITGLEIMWDLKENDKGKEWGGGHILDPKNGKTYKCRLRLQDEGEKLEVRGFIGFSLIGRSQTWLREP